MLKIFGFDKGVFVPTGKGILAIYDFVSEMINGVLWSKGNNWISPPTPQEKFSAVFLESFCKEAWESG